jgi:branched-chain amino acid transport system ATP-binding protein
MAATGGLSIQGITKRFQGLVALETVDLELAPGEALGLIGPNGSGKTTLFNVITGVYRPDAGRIVLEGEDITELPAHAISRRGIGRTFQNLRLFGRMSVYENVRAARHAKARAISHLWQGRAAARAERAAVMAQLEAVGLASRADDLAGELPLAGQRRLELARALAAEPRLLLLDEPAGGMTPAETGEMARLIAEHAMPGRGVIVIEHKIDMLARLCRRLCALNFGRKIAEGDAEAVLRDGEVLEAYLGTESHEAVG